MGMIMILMAMVMITVAMIVPTMPVRVTVIMTQQECHDNINQ
jgi:hypothetical protein